MNRTDCKERGGPKIENRKYRTIFRKLKNIESRIDFMIFNIKHRFFQNIPAFLCLLIAFNFEFILFLSNTLRTKS